MRRIEVLALLGVMAASTTSVSAADWLIPAPNYVFRPTQACVTDAARASKPARPQQAAYQVCADQMALFRQGLDTARASGKLLLITFGATWCPWCAALQRKINTPEVLGHKGDTLHYAATYHLLEIGLSTLHDAQQSVIPSGEDVLGAVLKRTSVKIRAIPFVAVVDPENPDRVFARNTDDLSRGAEGGHDLTGFRRVLVEAHAFVRATTPPAAAAGWSTRPWQRTGG